MTDSPAINGYVGGYESFSPLVFSNMFFGIEQRFYYIPLSEYLLSTRNRGVFLVMESGCVQTTSSPGTTVAEG